MKRIITLLFAIAALVATAQLSQNDAMGHLRPVSRAQMPARHYTINPSRSVTNIAIDYDSFDRKWAAQNSPDAMKAYTWAINSRNTNDSTYTLRYAVLTLDSLVDVNNNFAGTPKQGTTVRVDSFDIILNEFNVSGLPDTFIVSVFDKNTATVTGSGVTTNLNTTSLWADTLIADFSFFPTDTLFYLLTFAPNVTLPAGHVAGIKVEYRGDISDGLNMVASYREHCGTTNFSTIIADTNHVAPRNSSYYINLAANSGFYNYTTNLAVNSTSACKYFYMQNWWIFPYVTATTAGGVTPPTVVTTAATAVATTTATLNGTVNANGNSSTTSFDWGLTTSYGNTAAATPSPVVGTSPIAILAGLTGLTAATTYHYRAKGVNGGGTTNGQDMTFTTTGGSSPCTPAGGVTQGMSPASSAIPCINQGAAFSQTFTFVIPSTVLGVPVTSVHFDSIGNLPNGLTAAFSVTPATYNGGATGCFIVSGTTSYPCGQYWMPVYVTVVAGGNSFSNELSALATQFSLAGFEKKFLRIKSNAGTCPAVNGSQTALFVADATCGVASNLSASATSTNVDCFGGNNGSATVTATGGSTYTYLWNTGGTTATINGLTAGTYTVTVTSNGSTATASATVTQPNSAVTASATATQSQCASNTGSATVTPNGGTPGYNYSWTGGQTTAVATALGAGNYNVTVTDSKGCTATASASVTTPNGPSATFTTSDVSCFGGGNGAVDVTVTGGTGTLAYNWNNGTHSQDLSNLQPGSYSLTVVDANNCSFTISTTVNQPSAALSVSGNVTDATAGNSNGAVNITAAGGTANYTFSWSNQSSNEDLSGVAAGSYTVTVSDAHGCTTSGTYTVGTTVGIKGIEMVNKFAVFPNPASASVNVQVVLTETADMKIELVDLNGKTILTENTGAVKEYIYMLNTSAVANGVYMLRVTGAKFHVVKQLTIAK